MLRQFFFKSKLRQIVTAVALIVIIVCAKEIAENVLKESAEEKLPENQWITKTADDEGWVGIDSSIAIDTAGNPHISHFDAKNRDLKYAYLKDGVWVRERVDSTGHLGEESSIAVDIKGDVHISYNDITNGALKYAKKTGDSWSIETVDKKSQSHVTITSLALDVEGHSHIAYVMESAQYGDAIKYASWDGNSWQIEEATKAGNDLYFTLDSNDNPHIAFLVGSQGNKKIYYTGKTSGTWKTEIVDSSTRAGGDCGVAVDSKNYPHIVYRDYDKGAIKYAKWDGNSWQIQTIADNVGMQEGLRVAIDSQDRPHIVYADTKKEKLIHAFFDKDSWNKEIISKMGIPSIVIDSLDKVHVSHGSVTDEETSDPETGQEIEILKYSVRN